MNTQLCYNTLWSETMLRVVSKTDVNRRVPIVEIVKHYNIKGLTLFGDTLYRGVCPFCGDNEFQVMPTDASWLCCACGQIGKTFDLVAKMEKASEDENLNRINSWICGESSVGLIVCL
jgi:hypothetical protein